MSPLTRKRLLIAAGVALVMFALGARKYVRHRQRIPVLAMDAATLAQVRAVHVTVYSAEWCHSCRDAETFLRENGVPFEVKDIENDPAAAARADLLNPRHTIPVIDIEGAILAGYEPRAIEAELAKAAQRHAAGQGAPHS